MRASSEETEETGGTVTVSGWPAPDVSAPPSVIRSAPSIPAQRMPTGGGATMQVVGRDHPAPAGLVVRGGRARKPVARLLLIGLALTLLTGLMATGLAIATSVAGARAKRVESSLTEAGTAVRGVAATGAPLQPARLREQLNRLVQLDQDVRSQRGGLSWTVSRWTTRPGRLQLLDARAADLDRLAEAGRPLSAAVAAATSGAPDAGRLTDLARASAGYAAAARDSGITTDGGIRQLAAAAAVLPGLATGPGPRRWTVCPASTGRCEVMLVVDGKVETRHNLRVARVLRDAGTTILTAGSGSDDPVTVRLADVMLTGVAPATITADQNLSAQNLSSQNLSSQSLSGRYLSVTGLLDALLRSLETSAPGGRAVTVHAVVPLVAP